MIFKKTIEKLKKGCGKPLHEDINPSFVCGMEFNRVIQLCSTCQIKFKQIKKFSKAVEEKVDNCKKCPQCPREIKCIQIGELKKQLEEI